MPRDEDIIGDFPAYALGALDDDAQKAVEELVGRDADAAAELDEMLETVADFSAQVGEEEPPLPLRESLIAAVTADARMPEEDTASSIVPSDEAIIADFPAYSLGALDEKEQRAVEELIERDVDAANELADMLDTVADLSIRVGEVIPPVALRARLISAVNVETSAKEHATGYSALVAHLENRIATEEAQYEHDLKTIWQRLTGVFTAGRLAFATSFTALAIVGIMAIQLGTDNVQLNRRLTDSESMVSAAYAHAENMLEDMSTTEQLLSHAHDRISEQEQQIVRMTELNDALRTSMNDQISLTYATLRNEYQSPDWQPDAALSAEGYAYLLEHKRQRLGALVIGGVEKAPHGQEYRLYLIGQDEPQYVTSFDMNEAGYGTVLFELSDPLSNYLGAHITLEQSTEPPDPSLASLENRYKPQ